MNALRLPIILAGIFLIQHYSSGSPSVSDSSSTGMSFRSITTKNHMVSFSPDGNILSITSRYQSTKSSPVSSCTFSASQIGSPLLRFFAEAKQPLFTEFKETKAPDSGIIATFSNDTQSITWRFSPDGYVFSLSGTGVFFQDSLRITDCKLVSDNSGGHVRALSIEKHRVRYSDQTSRSPAIRWFGIRNHFWTLLVKPSDGMVNVQTDTHPAASVSGICMKQPHQITFYAGPVEFFSLRKAGSECTGLLYPLWFWMRWLSIGLLMLFTMFLHGTGNCVVSIILLSLSVKLILAPLYRIASRWQKEVNRQRSLLEPRLAEINKTFKGEEHTNKVLEVHRELDISPLYALKSLLSAAIQIPVFFAAYHMLSEHIALSGIPFLWIHDLSIPDHLFALPFSLPWFGNYFNVLPFVMTSITILTSCIHTDASLSSELHKRQRNSLLIMATLFFMLLYTSPAGMLCYWTMNNLFSFFETSFSALRRKWPDK